MDSVGQVIINIGPLNALLRALQNPKELETVWRLWAAYYSAFAQRRFRDNSRGGGDWPDLAASTKKRRRKGKRKGGRKFAILMDTGTLFKALSIGAKGNYTEPFNTGVRFGFDSVPHGGATASRATIQEIAAYHNVGSSKLPKRVILPQPDKDTVEKMFKAFGRFVERKARSGSSR